RQVSWLRTYARIMGSAGGKTRFDLQSVARAADHEFVKRRADYVGRSGVARDALASESARSPHRLWASTAADTLSKYRGAPDLVGDPLLIMTSQLHMFHNRIDVSIPEECYLALLAAMAIADRGEGTGFFDDSLEAADR